MFWLSPLFVAAYRLFRLKSIANCNDWLVTSFFGMHFILKKISRDVIQWSSLFMLSRVRQDPIEMVEGAMEMLSMCFVGGK